MTLQGKAVMVTGAGGNLAQAVLPAFRKVGARVIAVDRQVPQGLPEGEMGLAADVTHPEDVRRLIQETLEKTGPIDVLVNLVGAFAPGRLAETELPVWDQMLSLNLTAPFLLSRAVLPSMVQHGAGSILHIAARAAVEPFAGAAAYIVAKSALIALIKVLALEGAGSGVRVNGILPTTIDTLANRKSMPQADRNQWVKPDDLAALLVYLASDGAKAINGALIPIG
jgi:NAD(P)-dependent dehydrogenase (short-subunit alcohol dehydrogenase family)